MNEYTACVRSYAWLPGFFVICACLLLLLLTVLRLGCVARPPVLVSSGRQKASIWYVESSQGWQVWLKRAYTSWRAVVGPVVGVFPSQTFMFYYKTAFCSRSFSRMGSSTLSLHVHVLSECPYVARYR